MGIKSLLMPNLETIDVDLTDDELAKRKAAWTPRGTDYNAGAIWKYAQTVGPAEKGAITHPGGGSRNAHVCRYLAYEINQDY